MIGLHVFAIFFTSQEISGAAWFQRSIVGDAKWSRILPVPRKKQKYVIQSSNLLGFLLTIFTIISFPWKFCVSTSGCGYTYSNVSTFVTNPTLNPPLLKGSTSRHVPTSSSKGHCADHHFIGSQLNGATHAIQMFTATHHIPRLSTPPRWMTFPWANGRWTHQKKGGGGNDENQRRLDVVKRMIFLSVIRGVGVGIVCFL